MKNSEKKTPPLYTVQIIHKASEDEIEELYRHAGWWEEDWSRSFIAPMIEGSFLFAGAFLEHRLIGMGRALSDGVSDAYIQDVAVLREFRGQHIGSEIIDFLVKELRCRGIDWIGLIGEPGTKGFYQRLGFQEMQEFIPMRLS